jgi:predicted porin
MRRTQAAVRIVNDLGIFGVTPMLFGATSPPLSAGPTQVTLDSTFNGGSGQFSRRVNNSLSYESPVWQGVQVFAMVSAQSAATGTSNNASAGKPRLWSIAANYTNGPLLLTAAYEVHQNFNTGSPVALPPFPYQGTDTGWQIGAAYQAGPVKVGGLYTYQSYDLGTFGGLLPAQDLKVSAWNLAAEWAIQGPHALRGAYTKANDTKGNSILGFTNGLFNRNANGGAGNTGAHQWQIQYVYNASKRTELAAGYIRLQNDTLGGYYLDGGTNFTALGINQDAFAVSMKHSF